MPKKIEVKEETGALEIKEPELPVIQEKQETPPVNEEVAQLRSKLQSLEDNWKNEQRVSSKHIQKVQELEARLSDRKSDEDFQKMMFTLLAQSRGETEEETGAFVKANKPDLLKQYDDLLKQREAERGKREAEAKRDEYNRQADAVYAQAQSVFKDDEDTLWAVEDLLRTGNLERAQRKIEKAKVVTQPKAEDKQKEIEEAARKMLEEKGLLKTDTGGPSGTKRDFAEKEGAYSRGEISYEVYAQARKEEKID